MVKATTRNIVIWPDLLLVIMSLAVVEEVETLSQWLKVALLASLVP